MSERVLRLFLHELHTLRIKCQSAGCGALLEVSVDDVPRLFKNGGCPVCGLTFKFGAEDYLVQLVKALNGLQSVTDRVHVEFVIPESVSRP